jgi:uncharacterized NAD-dependent epimerase/dehydratase family protein
MSSQVLQISRSPVTIISSDITQQNTQDAEWWVWISEDWGGFKKVSIKEAVRKFVDGYEVQLKCSSPDNRL